MKNKVEIAIVILVLLVVGLACMTNDDDKNHNKQKDRIAQSNQVNSKKTQGTSPTPVAETQNTVEGEWLITVEGMRDKSKLVISGTGSSLRGTFTYPPKEPSEQPTPFECTTITFDGKTLFFESRSDPQFEDTITRGTAVFVDDHLEGILESRAGVKYYPSMKLKLWATKKTR